MLPDLPDLLAGAVVVSVPMGVRFRGVMHREALLVQGPCGWGEFSPFLEYDDVEAARWLAAAVEAAWTGWPAALRGSVPVNATVPAVAPGEVAGILAAFPGCSTVKVKVAEAGQSLAQDLDRVAAVRAAVGAAGRVRVDANGGWSVPDAVGALAALAAYDLEYAEQPCASVEDLAALRVRLAGAGLDVLVAADESVRRAEDPLRVARLGAADIVVVKVAPLGGVARALSVAQECGLPVVVSSALDTSVGISAGVALAAALPDLPYACGLATVSLMAADVTSAPLLPHLGALPVRPVVPDLAAAVTAAPDRARWWVERATRCWDILSAVTLP